MLMIVIWRDKAGNKVIGGAGSLRWWFHARLLVLTCWRFDRPDETGRLYLAAALSCHELKMSERKELCVRFGLGLADAFKMLVRRVSNIFGHILHFLICFSVSVYLCMCGSHISLTHILQTIAEKRQGKYDIQQTLPKSEKNSSGRKSLHWW